MTAHQTTHTSKAARLAVLLELDRLGLLDGLTQQQLTDILGAGHRSTVCRYLSDVVRIKAILPGLIARARDLVAENTITHPGY